MDKLTSLKGINKYFCIECEHSHIRKYKYIINKNGKRIKSKDTPFFNCKEHAYQLTATEKFNIQFNKSVENYSFKKHQKSIGSMKQ